MEMLSSPPSIGSFTEGVALFVGFQRFAPATVNRLLHHFLDILIENSLRSSNLKKRAEKGNTGMIYLFEASGLTLVPAALEEKIHA
jgi:hypothetical protein